MGTNGLIAVIATLAKEPRRPRLVCYTADGGRTELSGASLANWTAKVAGLLRDEMGLGPGDLAAVTAAGTSPGTTEPGWQVAPVLLGCWWAGITVTTVDNPEAAVAFVSAGGDAAADEVLVLSDHPLGAAPAGIAAHQRDLTSAALAHQDRLGEPAPHGNDWVAAVGDGQSVTAADLWSRVGAPANVLRASTPPGARPVLLSTRQWTIPDGIAHTQLAALAAGGTLVQCPAESPAADLARLARTENVTATIGARLPHLPHFDR